MRRWSFENGFPIAATTKSSSENNAMTETKKRTTRVPIPVASLVVEIRSSAPILVPMNSILKAAMMATT
jgi:hypothetical protein